MSFYCQSNIEDNGICEMQCDHCKEYYKPLEENKNMTREEFIKAAKELAIDFWGMNLTNGTYESNFIKLLDKYESKKERTESHIVDSSKFNNAQFNEDCKYGEVDARQYGLDPELLKIQWEQIVNDLDKLKEHIHKRGLSPNSIKEFMKEKESTKNTIDKQLLINMLDVNIQLSDNRLVYNIRNGNKNGINYESGFIDAFKKVKEFILNM